ncbi:hypothetical protein QBC34DRAFT_470801 [Podospora aff. communis PSN243]|uniref:DUF6604 domain-containing protein n=1 Tax=Podospora aff. communis PSN243 TaxID=3040156 RepID=A0AAV9GFU7_9PEZI|nr:hypothetical protein QBC34DRAFT_470801 [Podospora aff. communis PSN243]
MHLLTSGRQCHTQTIRSLLGPEKSVQQPTSAGAEGTLPPKPRQKKGKAKPVPVTLDASEEKSVHWSQLEVLAQRVVDNATPDDIHDVAIRILRNVVGLRKKSFKFFSSTTKDSDDSKVKQSNANHAHIIGVLERVLEKLETLVARAPNREPSKAPRQNSRLEVSDLSNMFAFLEVQTASDTAEVHDASVSAEEDEGTTKRSSGRQHKGGKKKGAKKQQKNRKGETQLARVATGADNDGSWIDRVDFGISTVDNYDADDELDYYMMMYCYFVDFNAIRSYVAERWCDYWYDRSVSLCTLSVITNAAFELFHQLEIDLVQQLPPPYRGMANYDFMLSALFFDFGLDHVDYDSYEGLSKHESDERIWRDEADWLAFSSWATISWMLKGIPPNKVPHIPPSQRDPVVYGANDMHAWHKFEKAVTMQLFFEMADFKARKKNGVAPRVLPAEPELFLDIQRILETRRDRSPAIFSLHLWVDIHNIMETDVVHPFEQLQATAARLKKTLESHDPAKMFNVHGLRSSWTARRNEVSYFMLEDFTIETQREKFREVGIEEDPVPFYFLQNEPVWAGLLDFRAKLAESQMGHLFIMLSPEVDAAAYLYHAALAADPTIPGWEMMRKYRQTYRLDSLFGLGLMGESAQRVLKNFSQVIRSYYSAASSNFHQRTTSPEPLSGRRTFNHAVDIRLSLFTRYAADDDASFMEYIEEITKYRLQMTRDAWEVANNRHPTSGPAALDKEDSGPSSDGADPSTALVKHVAGKLDREREKELRRKATLSQLSPIDMLQLLDDTITSQLDGILTLNYFQLYDESVSLLAAIAEAFGPDLEKRASVECAGKPGYLGMIPKLLADDVKGATGTTREHEIVQTIVDVVKAHVSKLRGTWIPHQVEYQ